MIGVGYATAFVLLLLAQGTARAQPAPAASICPTCVTMTAAVAGLSQQREQTRKLLDTNRAALLSFQPSEVSKKIKVSSTILILSARVETYENNLLVKGQEFQKMGCSACPKP